MAQFPYLPLFTDAWKADTLHLSYAQRGLYLDLLVEMWRTPGCRVPNDDAWLAQHLRLSGQEVAEALRPIIREFCQSDGNHLTQKRLKKEFVYAFERAGRLSALAKRRKRKANGPNGSRSAAAVGQPNLSLKEERNLSSGESQQPPPVENVEPVAPPPQPPQSLADLNHRMGWTPAGTRKPSP
jgi:uncharacterized protein YdaU (DUF1376 family)